MKLPRRTAIKPVIYLLAEDETGFHVMQVIIREKRINATVKLLGQAQGVSRLASEVDELIQLALAEKSPGDCILVLHDTDDSVQPDRSSYDKITRICSKYKSDVTQLKAREEVESWLLADKGLCKWLGIKAKPSDHLQKPSEILKSYVNKHVKNLIWNKRNQPEILKHMDAIGDKTGGSPSMRSAMKKLANLPCFQPEPQ